jgi:hypothetical protein
MVSYLPLPGGFASLANRVLSPSIVSGHLKIELTIRDSELGGYTSLGI